MSDLPDKLKKWSVVEVTWEDVVADSGMAHSHSPDARLKPAIRKTLGYVIGYSRVKRKVVFIAGTDDRRAGLEGDCSDVNRIPLPYVISIDVIRE